MFCIPSKVSSNFCLSSSSLIASNNFAVSPKSELLCTVPITENKISCKYFQMVSLVLSLISRFQSCLNTIPGKNSVLCSESSKKSSGFLYKISKKRSGNTLIQCLKTTSVSFFFVSSSSSSKLFHHLEIIPEYSGKVIKISIVKSLIILKNSSGGFKSSIFLGFSVIRINLIKEIYLNQTNLNILIIFLIILFGYCNILSNICNNFMNIFITFFLG